MLGLNPQVCLLGCGPLSDKSNSTWPSPKQASQKPRWMGPLRAALCHQVGLCSASAWSWEGTGQALNHLDLPRWSLCGLPAPMSWPTVLLGTGQVSMHAPADHHTCSQHPRGRVCLQICSGQRPKEGVSRAQGQHHEADGWAVHKMLPRGCACIALPLSLHDCTACHPLLSVL